MALFLADLRESSLSSDSLPKKAPRPSSVYFMGRPHQGLVDSPTTCASLFMRKFEVSLQG